MAKTASIRRRMDLVHLAFAAVLVGCGGGGGGEPHSTAAPPPAPVTAPPPSAGLSLLAGDTYANGTADGVGRAAYFRGVGTMALHPDQSLWLTYPQSPVVRRVAADGSVTTLAGSPLAFGVQDGRGSEARFQGPSAITIGPDGAAYLIDQPLGLRRVTPDGTVQTLFTMRMYEGVSAPFAPGDVGFTQHVAAGADGAVYVATPTAVYRWTQATGRVRVAPAIEGFIVPAGYQDGPVALARFTAITGLAVDPQGNIFVSEGSERTIRRIGTDGQVTTFAGARGSTAALDGVGGNARFAGPGALTIDAAGALWVYDAPDAYRKVTPSGEVSTPLRSTAFVGRNATGAVISTAVSLPDHAGGAWLSRGTGVSRLTPSGEIVPLAGQDSPSDRGLATVAALGVDAAGNTHLVEAELARRSDTFSVEYAGRPGPFEWRRVSPSGEATVVPATIPEGQWGNGFGFDAAGNLYMGAPAVKDTAFVTAAGGAIYKFAPDGTRTTLRTWTESSPDRLSPACLTVGADGALYFVDAFTWVLVRWTPEGGARTVADANPGMPISVTRGVGCSVHYAADANGRVWLARNNAIYRAEAGQLMLVAGQPSAAPISGRPLDGIGAAATFAFPRSIATDRAGNLLVAELSGLVRRVTPEGVVTTVAGNRGSTGFQPGPLPGSLGQLRRIAAAQDGFVVVSDRALVRARLP